LCLGRIFRKSAAGSRTKLSRQADQADCAVGAGGGTDIVARIIALKLSENLGQQIEVESWRGLFVPARTPREVINKLHDQVDKVVQLQEIRERIMAAGFDTVTSTPEQLGAFSVAELAKWAKVAKEAGVRVK
jgi:tripartite-type tricarboxylate transporter receptor subunit TctC